MAYGFSTKRYTINHTILNRNYFAG